MTRFRFVEEHQADYPIKRLCAVVEVSRSGYYAWKARPPAPRTLADEQLILEIEEIYVDSRRTYGAPRVHGQLVRRDRHVGCKRVARLMRAQGWVGAHAPKKKRRRRRSDVHGLRDLVRRDFTAARPNLRWVADITEFPTGEGPLFVAGIRDLCHKGIVGWSMADRQDAELVIDALVMALARCEPDPECVHHSDKGTQYTSTDFTAMATLAGLQVSFGATGDCFDNAAIESTWSLLKREIAWIRGTIYFETRDDAKVYLFEFIEVFYNRQRHQEALDHMTPVEYAATFDPGTGGQGGGAPLHCQQSSDTHPDETSPFPNGANPGTLPSSLRRTCADDGLTVTSGTPEAGGKPCLTTPVVNP